MNKRHLFLTITGVILLIVVIFRLYDYIFLFLILIIVIGLLLKRGKKNEEAIQKKEIKENNQNNQPENK